MVHQQRMLDSLTQGGGDAVVPTTPRADVAGLTPRAEESADAAAADNALVFCLGKHPIDPRTRSKFYAGCGSLVAVMGLVDNLRPESPSV